MATVLDLSANLQSVNVKVIAATSLQATADEFTEANKKQMMKGKRNDGKNIGDSPGQYYGSMMYARDKQRMNSEPGFMNPDLKLTGSFQNMMYMNVEGENILMDSADSKAESLVEKYGESIYGHSEPVKIPYVEDHLLPEFQSQIEKATGLKFG